MPAESYKIIRFFQRGANRTVKTGLTLTEARAHCSQPDSQGAGWYDGFTRENPEPTQVAADLTRLAVMIRAQRDTGLVAPRGRYYADSMRAKCAGRGPVEPR